MKRKLIAGIAQLVGSPLLSALFSTTTVRILNRRVHEEYICSRRGAIGAGWHRHFLFHGWFFSWKHACAMVSRSFDGEIITRVMSRRGWRFARGSSSRGGSEAMAAMLDLMRLGWRGALVVDGPRGPAFEAKIGSVVLARRSGYPILPTAVHFDKAIYLNSWDRSAIPLPGCVITVNYGEPIHVPPNIEDCEPIRRELTRVLNFLQHEITPVGHISAPLPEFDQSSKAK